MSFSQRSFKRIAMTAALVAGVGAVVMPPDALQAGTSAYRYDSHGRLYRACNTTAGQGYRTDYALDAADNRSSYTNVKTDILMPANTSLYSPDGRFFLRMQSDGNLVVYQAAPLVALWQAGLAGLGGNRAYFQSDGNLVVYRTNGTVVWHSVTYGQPCSKLEVANDGNVFIRNLDGTVIWTTNTGGH